MQDLHGNAILDYYKGERDQTLLLHNNYGKPEEMPIETFFREHEDFTELEQLAIASCTGKILDIGSAAGAHALFMQALEMDIVALDNSAGCITTLEKSGMNKVVGTNYQDHKDKYDTLLLLMNGIGIIGKLNQFSSFIKKAKSLLNKGGQVILDSSDINYLYDDGLPKPVNYFGELRYRYEYQGEKGDWFDWVYIDPKTLEELVKAEGLSLEILHTDEYDQYLAKITGF